MFKLTQILLDVVYIVMAIVYQTLMIALLGIRFAEVAELLAVCWFDIRGKIDCRLLTPRTTYAAYLVFKLTSGSYGLGPPPQLATVKLGAYASEIDICLQDDDDDDGDDDDGGDGDDDDDDDDDNQEEGMQHQRQQHSKDDGWMEIDDDDHDDGDDDDQEEGMQRQQLRHLRDNGWMEIELGEFYNDEGDDGDVEMSLREVKALHWKSGLIIQGLEVRPKS